MFIKRGNLEFALTPEEMRAAFEEQQRDYRLEDAERQLYEYIDYAPFSKRLDKNGNETNPDNLIVMDDFRERYGISLYEAVDNDSERCILNQIVDEYERCHDCNCAENDLWQAVVDHVLTMIEDDRRKGC